MKLTKEQVLNIARLARLGLSEAEVSKFQKELSRILEYVAQLEEVDTEGVSPTAQVTGLLSVMREDVAVIPGDPEALANPDALLSCSPLPIVHRQIQVKKVL